MVCAAVKEPDHRYRRLLRALAASGHDTDGFCDVRESVDEVMQR